MSAREIRYQRKQTGLGNCPHLGRPDARAALCRNETQGGEKEKAEMITALVLLWLFGLPQQPVIVTQFGADPTGQQDSAAALRLAVSVAVARDCGALAYCSDDGNAIYLDGGDYLLGQPK